MTDYRTRIYEYYVHARQQSLAPENLEGLKPRKAYLQKLIRTHFPENHEAKILDLGCGHGALIYFARSLGYCNTIGVDRSPEQVKAAKLLNIEGVRQGDLTETLKSLPENSYDVIITFDVIEHFTKEEILIFVDEVKRVLAPSGKWIIHTPNGESPFASRMFFWDFTHELAFTRQSISQLLLASGFNQVKCFEDEPIFHGIKSAIRLVLWKLIRGILRIYLAVETGSIKRGFILSQNFLTIAIK